MKKDSFFFRAALALCLMLGSASVWSQTVIAGWTFPNNSSSNRIFNAQCGFYSGASQIFANGENGSSDWNGSTILNNTYLEYPQGSNQPAGFCVNNTGTYALSFYGGSNTGAGNNKSIVFKISTSNFKNIKLLYNVSSGNLGYTTHTFEYRTSTTGAYIPISNVSATNFTSSYGVAEVDFSGATGVNSQSELYIKLIFSGAGWFLGSGRNNLDNIRFTGDPIVTTWDGSSWDYGAPRPSSIAKFTGAYVTGTTRPNITASSVIIENGGTLHLTNAPTGTQLNLNGGPVTVNHGGNFIEHDNSLKNIGTFTLNKNTQTDAPRYTFWSSPVQNQNMYGIYPAAPQPQYVMTYNTATDYYTTLLNSQAQSTPGVGYSVKVPVNDAPAQFIGAPNSGTVNVSLETVGNRYNLIGNPYPSNLSLIQFHTQNTSQIESTFYFWNNIAPNNVQQAASGTEWTVFNASGTTGTWNPIVGGIPVNPNLNHIQPGQAFIVKAKSSAASVNFTYAMRSSAESTFFNKAAQNGSDGKFWLRLQTPAGAELQTAITYGEGALNTFEAFDSKMISVGANALYTYDGTNKMSIQGRDYFVNTDVVTVGNKHSAAGQYTISLAGTTGLFAAGQVIYLRDKQTGIYTNLQTDNYTFTTDALEQQNRFEVVYMPQGALGTAETVKGETVVYKDGEHFTVKADEKILSIEVYDAAGRLTEVLKPNRNQTQVFLKSKGVYLLKIKTVTGETTKKILK